VSDEQIQLVPLYIKPSSGWVRLQLGELWEYRELLYFLAWRDLKVRYKQTTLGIVWVILQPLLMTLVFTIAFGRFGGVPAETRDTPYPVFAFCGLLPWQFFAYVLNNSGNSLVASERLITKIYFPRLVIPMAGVLSGLVDFVITFVILLVLMVTYGILPNETIWLFPAFFALAVACAVGMGLWLAALNIEYRDVRHTIPFLIQLWFFVSPVAYPLRVVPEQWRWLYGLNPMVGVIEGFRWTLLGQGDDVGLRFVFPMLVGVIVLISGLYYFRRMEKDFADLV
jgi:lipopolysaccharide transport system permease protein